MYLNLVTIYHLPENQRQNEQRCEQEIEEMKRVVKSGGNSHETSLIRFSDEALEEQKHSLRIADEKVALAQQVYDMVNIHFFTSYNRSRQ